MMLSYKEANIVAQPALNDMTIMVLSYKETNMVAQPAFNQCWRSVNRIDVLLKIMLRFK